MSPVDLSLAAGGVDRQQAEDGSTPPRWRLLDRLEKTAIGTRKPDGITTVRRREPAGCVLYGPYWQLPSGTYRLDFGCRSGEPRLPTAPVLGVEVIAMNRIQLAWLDLTAPELDGETGSVEFMIPTELGLGAGDEARLEFRFFHLGNADLTIDAVELRPTQAAELPLPPARSWRLLGRLGKAWIARRSRTGISVGHAARPGKFLDGCRPFLQLPRGDYRLDFRCAAGVARMPSQPVLGVEILAYSRWRGRRLWSLSPTGGVQQAWADFTQMELGAGSGSINFTVPAELSLEGGQEVLYGFRFFHLGSADLTIRAVDLHRMSDQVSSQPPREWRLLGRLRKGGIGTLSADWVTVQRDEPAGVLLYGPRPDVTLAPGRYRLNFSCRTGPPRNAAQPLLELSVLARKRAPGENAWRPLLGPTRLAQLKCSFGSDELRGGSGFVEFEVAPRPSDIEAGTRYEFVFRHLGNADLAIGAVDLREIVDLEQPQAAPLRTSIAVNRTSIVIVGNCQAQTVHEAFLRSSELNTRFDARYHFVGLQRNLHELGRSELQNCDILLVQEIRDWENYPLRPFLREDLPVIKFPLLHFASLWPFDHYNGPGDREAYEREWPNLTFLYQDGLLARLRKEIPDPEERLTAYRSLSVDGIINYIRLHDFERRRLSAMDRQFGFKIGAYILENFQNKRLFYTTNHPNGRIIAMLMQHLLKNLGVERGYRPISSLDHLNRLQVPVHPKIAEALGVRWAGENTKYRYGGEEITWETYVRRYIDHYG